MLRAKLLELIAFWRKTQTEIWLHPKKRVISRVGDGIRFLGFRVWRDYRWLDRSNVQKLALSNLSHESSFAAVRGQECESRSDIAYVAQSLRRL